MDIKAIQKRLEAMTALLAEKGIKSPDTGFEIGDDRRFRCTVQCSICAKQLDGDYMKFFRADEAEEALAKAETYVASLGDVEVRQKRKWHRKLADVIDEGHELALPDEVMDPLRKGSQAMTKNLLTHQEAT